MDSRNELVQSPSMLSLRVSARSSRQIPTSPSIQVKKEQAEPHTPKSPVKKSGSGTLAPTSPASPRSPKKNIRKIRPLTPTPEEATPAAETPAPSSSYKESCTAFCKQASEVTCTIGKKFVGFTYGLICKAGVKFFGTTWPSNGTTEEKVEVIATQTIEVLFSALQLYGFETIHSLAHDSSTEENLNSEEWSKAYETTVNTLAIFASILMFLWTKNNFNANRLAKSLTNNTLDTVEDGISDLKHNVTQFRLEIQRKRERLATILGHDCKQITHSAELLQQDDDKPSSLKSKASYAAGVIARATFTLSSVNPAFPIGWFLNKNIDTTKPGHYAIVSFCIALGAGMILMTHFAFKNGHDRLELYDEHLKDVKKDLRTVKLNTLVVFKELTRFIESAERHLEQLKNDQSPYSVDSKADASPSMMIGSIFPSLFQSSVKRPEQQLADILNPPQHQEKFGERATNYCCKFFCSKSGLRRLNRKLLLLLSATLSASSAKSIYKVCESLFGYSDKLKIFAFALAGISFVITYNGFKTDCYFYDPTHEKLTSLHREAIPFQQSILDKMSKQLIALNHLLEDIETETQRSAGQKALVQIDKSMAAEDDNPLEIAL